MEEIQKLITHHKHSPEAADKAAPYVDVLQIPTFLCRQTDLLVAAARTGRIVNIKKGQFLSPESMRFAADSLFLEPHPDPSITKSDSANMLRLEGLIKKLVRIHLAVREV